MKPLTTKLGTLENLFDLANNVGNLIYVNVIEIEGAIDSSILRQSLYLLQKQHTLLQVHLAESDNGNYFQSDGTFNIPLQIIEKHSDRQWQKIAENELHQKFVASQSPLCRCTLIDGSSSDGISKLIVTFHHGIADGICGMHLFARLFSIYRELARGENLKAKTADEPLPSIENLVRDSWLKTQTQQQIEKNSAPEVSPAALIIEQQAAPSDRRSHFLCRTIERESTQTLIERCRQEKTTVQGALCAAMLFSAARHTAIDLPTHLSCGSSINLRKYCQPAISDRHFACITSRIVENHSLTGDTKFWDLARECKAKITNSLVRGTHLELIMSERMRNFNQDAIAQLANYQMGRDMTAHISNLGKIELDRQYDSLKIREIYFAVGQHVFGACFLLGAITFQSQLFLTFTHAFPLIGDETGEWFANLAVEILERATTPQDFAIRDLEQQTRSEIS